MGWCLLAWRRGGDLGHYSNNKMSVESNKNYILLSLTKEDSSDTHITQMDLESRVLNQPKETNTGLHWASLSSRGVTGLETESRMGITGTTVETPEDVVHAS